jgi:hypothetical protein
MPGEQLQHVVQEVYSGGNLVTAAAVDFQRAANLSFLGMRSTLAVRKSGLQLIDVVDDRLGALVQ